VVGGQEGAARHHHPGLGSRADIDTAADSRSFIANPPSPPLVSSLAQIFGIGMICRGRQVMAESVAASAHGPVFNSYRSPVVARRGMVACSQPLASQAGLSILMKGGNAADAAVAMAAALNVTEPASTGLGGDCFALYFDAKTKNITAPNGSGRAPAGLT